MMIPVAPSIFTFSRSGEEIAAVAASTARLSPLAAPVPMIAIPFADITVRMSAKSKLIKPRMLIKSEIPLTACKRTSSAFLNVSRSGVLSAAIASNF
ncbi:hypothetical protein D3C87_1265870 [compost metagenome]